MRERGDLSEGGKTYPCSISHSEFIARVALYFARKIVGAQREEKLRIERSRDPKNLLRIRRFECTSDRFVVTEASDRFLYKKGNDVDLSPARLRTESRDRVLLASVDNEKLH